MPSFFRKYSAEILLFVLGIAVFLPTLNYGLLIYWDDSYYIDPKNFVFTWERVLSLWNDKVLGLWTPLATVSYMIDYAVFGENFPMYHLAPILMHGLTGVLFFRILRFFRIRKSIAWCAALLWLIHPCRLESVVWLSERKDVLSLFLATVSFSVFLHEHRKKQIPWKSLLIYLLALTAKPSVIGLPIAAGAYVFYRSGKRIPWKTLLSVIILCICGLLLFQQRMGFTLEFYPFPHLLIVLFHNICFYLVSAVLPVQPDFCYPLVDMPSLLQLIPGTAAILVYAILAAHFSGMPKSRFVRFGLCAGAAWLAFFAPVSSLFIFNPTDYADRYTYCCSLVVIAFLAYLMHCLLKHRPEYKRITAGIFILLAAASLYRTIEYLPYWNNDEQRVRRSFERYEFPNTKVLLYQGEFCINKGDVKGCLEVADSYFHTVEEEHFYRPVRDYKTSFMIHGELNRVAGLVYAGNFGEAAACMERIYALTDKKVMLYGQPRYLPQIKQIYFKFLQWKKAPPQEFIKFCRWCKSTSKIFPGAVDDMILGYYAFLQKDYEAALKMWEKYLLQNPNDVQVRRSYEALKKMQKEKQP